MGDEGFGHDSGTRALHVNMSLVGFGRSWGVGPIVICIGFVSADARYALLRCCNEGFCIGLVIE